VPGAVRASGTRQLTRSGNFTEYAANGLLYAERLEDWWRLVAEAGERMTTALEDAGRATDQPFRRVLQTDAAPVLSIQSAGCFEDLVGRANALGFTDVVAPWPREQGPFSAPRSVVDQIAAEVLPRWKPTRADASQAE
jgi:hypothetical protein